MNDVVEYIDGSRLKYIHQTRNTLLESTGIDLFKCPIFIEQAVCFLANSKNSGWHDKFDMTTENGLRIEIKYSKRGGNRKIYQWSNLNGSNKLGKEADAFILVGYDPSDNEFHFWIVPSVINMPDIIVHDPNSKTDIVKRFDRYAVLYENLFNALRSVKSRTKEFDAYIEKRYKATSPLSHTSSDIADFAESLDRVGI